MPKKTRKPLRLIVPGLGHSDPCAPCHLSCVPKQGDAKEGHPAEILNARLGRPRYISETRR